MQEKWNLEYDLSFPHEDNKNEDNVLSKEMYEDIDEEQIDEEKMKTLHTLFAHMKFVEENADLPDIKERPLAISGTNKVKGVGGQPGMSGRKRNYYVKVKCLKKRKPKRITLNHAQ